ncbi:MAG: hypothetical protein HY651_00690 [Acidobacteria bacterium]|nr:hypothetical protein [Acidobacteriota bacterium]
MLLLSQGEARSAALQEAPQTPPPYLTVGAVEGSPGASLIVPLYYAAEQQTPIRSFTLEIEFVSNNLEFQDASKGIVDQESLEIASSLTKGTPDSAGVTRSKLRLTAKLADENAKQGLGEGLLAYLMFQLSLEAKPFVIKLTPTVVAAEDTEKPARKVTKLGALPGSISVLSMDVMPEMACFFFTH